MSDLSDLEAELDRFKVLVSRGAPPAVRARCAELQDELDRRSAPPAPAKKAPAKRAAKVPAAKPKKAPAKAKRAGKKKS